jgi:hypothetical protein
MQPDLDLHCLFLDSDQETISISDYMAVQADWFYTGCSMWLKMLSEEKGYNYVSLIIQTIQNWFHSAKKEWMFNLENPCINWGCCLFCFLVVDICPYWHIVYVTNMNLVI